VPKSVKLLFSSTSPSLQGGDIKVEVEGVKGARCLELTQAIETLLGEIKSRQLKNDFSEQAKLKQTIALKQIGKKEKAPR